MNFFFVDRILEMDPGKHSVGVMHITATNPFLVVSPTDGPVILSSVIGEALGQLGAWNVLQQNDFSLWPIAGIIGESRTLSCPKIGDTVILDTTIESCSDENVVYQSKAMVDGEVVLTQTDAVGPMIPVEELMDPEHARSIFNKINRPGSMDEYPIYDNRRPFVPEGFHHTRTIFYDNILQWDLANLEAEAQKNVTVTSPYFDEHFPRMPVMPLSLVMEGQALLARQFLSELLGEEEFEKYYLSRVYNVKISGFVQPGDSLVTKFKLKRGENDSYIFRYRSEVNGKKICTAFSEYLLKEN